MNDELQKGLNAAFALAFSDEKYIYDFVNVLRTFDLNNEVYEPFFIDLLLDKWMICDEVLFLLAARSGSISDQWGFEKLEIPTLNGDHKNKFLTYLLEDALKSKTVFSENLLDSMELLDIVVDPEKFSRLFEHYKPLFQKDNILVYIISNRIKWILNINAVQAGIYSIFYSLLKLSLLNYSPGRNWRVRYGKILSVLKVE